MTWSLIWNDTWAVCATAGETTGPNKQAAGSAHDEQPDLMTAHAELERIAAVREAMPDGTEPHPA